MFLLCHNPEDNLNLHHHVSLKSVIFNSFMVYKTLNLTSTLRYKLCEMHKTEQMTA